MQLRQLLGALWRNRTGPFLVAMQVAIALTVLVNVAFIVHAYLQTNSKPTGIDLQNVFWISTEGYAADYDHAATLTADLIYLNSLPGVQAAASISVVPQTFSGTVLPFAIEPGAEAIPEAAVIFLTTERAVETLGLRVIAGSGFGAESVVPPSATLNDALGRWAAEVVITRALAEKLFPAGDALGKTIHVGLVNRSSTVIGIVERMQAVPASGPGASIAEQVALVPVVPPGPSATYLVRTEPGLRDAVMAKVEMEFEDLQPGRFVNRVESLQRTASWARASNRATAVILAVIAWAVLLVTAGGIFGLAAFSVATRTREIGTRRAVGARKSHIVVQFIAANWIVTSLGVLLGCALALGLGARLSVALQLPRLPLLYLAGGVLTLWIVSLIAVLVPVRRAAAVSPAVATRTV